MSNLITDQKKEKLNFIKYTQAVKFCQTRTTCALVHVKRDFKNFVIKFVLIYCFKVQKLDVFNLEYNIENKQALYDFMH